MQKQLGENVKVLGIEGNFDDAQSALKNIFVSDPVSYTHLPFKD